MSLNKAEAKKILRGHPKSNDGSNLKLEVSIGWLYAWKQFGNDANDHFVICEQHRLNIWPSSSNLPDERVVLIEELEAINTTIVMIGDINWLYLIVGPLRHHLGIGRWIILITLDRSVTIAENPVEAAAFYLISRNPTYVWSDSTCNILLFHCFSWPYKHLAALRVQTCKLCQSAPFLVEQNFKHFQWVCFPHFLQQVRKFFLVPDFLLR